MKALPDAVKWQLVLDQMAKDPTGMQGPCIIKEGIAHDTGQSISWDWIWGEMHKLDSDTFTRHAPTTKKIHCVATIALGLHHRWSGDGHNKLNKIGFLVWAIQDVWSGKWLGIWVVPDNCLKYVIVYLYLSLVEELEGMPLLMVTDCGSETTKLYGFACALREAFVPNLSIIELPTHQFTKSICNTTIEHDWLQMRLQWGDNIITFWEAGCGIYDPNNTEQYELVQWLWSKLIQKELDDLKDHFNDHIVWCDRNKLIPSGVAPNIAYALYEQHGGENCLQPTDRAVIHHLMEELGGKDLICFIPTEYAENAQSIYDTLGIKDLTLQNV